MTTEQVTTETCELFVAVRCEELPARFVKLAADKLAGGLVGLLGGIQHGAVRTWSTPRRIAVAVDGVALGKPKVEKLVTGPPAASAFAKGKPTGAATGFARGKGVAVDALEIVEGPRGPVVAARITQGGERTADLVSAGLADMVLGIRFPMSMRWQTGGPRWARPIHGLIAIFGGELVPSTLAGVASGLETVGHRLTPGPVVVHDADSWVSGLRAHNVEPDPTVRRERIQRDLEAAAASAGAALVLSDSLLDEVVDLVEWPVPVLCTFDAELLTLPPRLLVESMRVHQKVFPLWQADASDRLDHRFLTVSNHPFATQPATAATIASGNAKVIGARFHDARFFYAEDRKLTLEQHDHKLARMQWIRKGGTMQQKAGRVAVLAHRLAPAFGAEPNVARRAGRLCKADLATQMVGEFPELQGHVGRLLAGFDGEPQGVPAAIEEHYLPRGAGDNTPSSAAGQTLAVADRLDTLAGCFAAGIRLKGSSDPLGLRRAALGLLRILLDTRVRVPLAELFDLALDGLNDDIGRHGESPGADRDDLVAFTSTRLRALLREDHDTEVVDAVLDAGGERDPVALHARVAALAALASTPDFGPVKTTFKRVMGLTRDHDSSDYDPAALAEPAERALHLALSTAIPAARQAETQLDYDTALQTLASLKVPVDSLFDSVMVMAPDPTVRSTRLGLLRSVAKEFHRIADFAALSAD